MDAMPQMYRDDIARTQQAIEEIDHKLVALRAGLATFARGSALREAIALGVERRAALVRQLEELERALVRAEQDWAAAVAQGAGVRLDP